MRTITVHLAVHLLERIKAAEKGLQTRDWTVVNFCVNKNRNFFVNQICLLYSMRILSLESCDTIFLLKGENLNNKITGVFYIS